jgi:cytochrome c-type biogenesis protein CcmE
MKPKNQRLALIGAAIAAVLVAVLLAIWGLREQASYFYTPTDIRAGKAAGAKALRLGGMVQKGSLQHDPDGLTIHFLVTDGKATIPVTYRGIVPDLFREGSGVVAEGHVVLFGIARPGSPSPFGQLFEADTILAKHDERYMPPELGNLSAEHKAGKTLER